MIQLLYQYDFSLEKVWPVDYAFPDRRVCNIFLDLDDEMRKVSLPDEIAFQYQCRQPICEEKDAALSDVVMHYKSSRKYQCLSPDGEVLWEEKHQGYRYTPWCYIETEQAQGPAMKYVLKL